MGWEDAPKPRGAGAGPGRGHTAALLVGVVPAVVVVVALPAAWHAAVVLAAELVGLTGALVCKRQGWRAVTRRAGGGPQGLRRCGQDGQGRESGRSTLTQVSGGSLGRVLRCGANGSFWGRGGTSWDPQIPDGGQMCADEVVSDSATPWTAACQASLSFTVSWVCPSSCSLPVGVGS